MAIALRIELYLAEPHRDMACSTVEQAEVAVTCSSLKYLLVVLIDFVLKKDIIGTNFTESWLDDIVKVVGG